MMAQAGATLISLGRKPGNKDSRKEELAFGGELLVRPQYPQSLPANRAPMPSCVRILRITLMVELETWSDTGNKKQTVFSGKVMTTVQSQTSP